jgi:hypothetical protein
MTEPRMTGPRMTEPRMTNGGHQENPVTAASSVPA